MRFPEIPRKYVRILDISDIAYFEYTSISSCVLNAVIISYYNIKCQIMKFGGKVISPIINLKLYSLLPFSLFQDYILFRSIISLTCPRECFFPIILLLSFKTVQEFSVHFFCYVSALKEATTNRS